MLCLLCCTENSSHHLSPPENIVIYTVSVFPAFLPGNYKYLNDKMTEITWDSLENDSTTLAQDSVVQMVPGWKTSTMLHQLLGSTSVWSAAI